MSLRGTRAKKLLRGQPFATFRIFDPKKMKSVRRWYLNLCAIHVNWVTRLIKKPPEEGLTRHVPGQTEPRASASQPPSSIVRQIVVLAQGMLDVECRTSR